MRGRAHNNRKATLFMFENFDKRYNHMPFAAPGDEVTPLELCCIRDNGFWKLHGFINNRWTRIYTGLPEDATECSPTAEYEDGIWKISFIAGGFEKDRRFRLYRMYGIDGEVMPQCFADVGYVRKNQIVFAGRRGAITILESTRKITLQLKEVEYLYRLSYDPFHPNRMLISGQFINGHIFSWIYTPGLKILKNILTDGLVAYKCALYGSECYYAKQGNNFEDRRIVKAQIIDITELNGHNFISETEESVFYNNVLAEFE